MYGKSARLSLPLSSASPTAFTAGKYLQSCKGRRTTKPDQHTDSRHNAITQTGMHTHNSEAHKAQEDRPLSAEPRVFFKQKECWTGCPSLDSQGRTGQQICQNTDVAAAQISKVQLFGLYHAAASLFHMDPRNPQLKILRSFASAKKGRQQRHMCTLMLIRIHTHPHTPTHTGGGGGDAVPR